MEWVYYFNMKKNLRPAAAGREAAFTLVELMIVVSIIIIMAVMMVSIFNATGVLNKARDAQRKKDVGRIKVAFEEYFNDKGCYPNQTIVDSLNMSTNCGKNVFSPWLSLWPCDPNKSPYRVVVENPDYSTCNKWYKVLVNLENKKDSDIPAGWYNPQSFLVIGVGISIQSVNYGVSSSNINWFDKWVDPRCATGGQGCLVRPINSTYGTAGTGCVSNAYNICASGWPSDTCQVACCGAGCH